MAINEASFETSVAAYTAPATQTRTWLGLMVVLWGLSWPATHIALSSVPPLWLAAIRFGSGGAVLFAFVAIRGQLVLPARGDVPIVLSVGLLQMMAFTGLGMIAMTRTDTSHAVLLAYSTPLWSALIGAVFLRRMPTHGQAVALALGLAGVALIVSPLELDWSAPGTMRGAAFLIAAAICWSIVILHVRCHRWQGSPLSLAPWQMLVATIPLAGLAFHVHGAPVGLNMKVELLGLLTFIGPVATSACFVISSEHGRRITPFAMSNVTLGVPVLGVAFSVLLLGNDLSPIFMAGLVMVVLGMALSAHDARGGPAKMPGRRSPLPPS